MKHVRTLKRSALALAIAMAASAPLHAQSNSQGYIFGQVSGGGSVVVENLGTGQKREIAVDADGNFRASALPPLMRLRHSRSACSRRKRACT